MILTDVNLMVYAHRADLAQHLKSRIWLENLVNSDELFGLSNLVLSGFIRVITHPKVFESPSSLKDAMEFIEQLTELPNCRIVMPGQYHWKIFRDLCVETNAVGNFVPDAYHAALAIESGCIFATADKGFKKFKGLKSINPIA